MKLNCLDNKGFTLSEMLVALAISSLMLAAVITASVALQKSFNAVDNYFAAHMQQIRIIDFLSRDVKRSYIVNTTPDKLTVTCTLPNYLIAAGDPDATGSNIGTRRKPTISSNANGVTVSYKARTVSDANMTNGSPTLTSPLALFTSSDVGQSIAGAGIPAGTKIQSTTNITTVTLSNNATSTVTGATVTIGSLSTVVYSVAAQTIQRRENGVLTTIAGSAEDLLPITTDVDLANTEYTQSTVTFLPIFTKSTDVNVNNTKRAGTTIFSLSYLRNKRRG